MQPRPHKALPCSGLRLRNLVFVVREDKVDAARMEIKTLTEIAHAHRRALQVPARSTRTD